MRIGIIGLGNIAQKAYLPVILNNKDVTPVLCTRNALTLQTLAQKYRVSEVTQSLDELLTMGIEAAFIHSSTESHVPIAEKLLKSNIPVFVDKPFSYNYREAEKLVELSEKKGVVLFTGFNRRFAPMYSSLKDAVPPKITIMQKNRVSLPGKVRTFIFDDFIHVVDTIRFLSPELSSDISVNHYKKDGELLHVTVQFTSENYTAIAVMNRNNGISEEVLEVMKEGEKHVVRDLNSKTLFVNNEEKVIKFNDWDTVLFRRGFEEMIRHFLLVVQNKEFSRVPARDALLTHWFCEEIVLKIES